MGTPIKNNAFDDDAQILGDAVRRAAGAELKSIAAGGFNTAIGHFDHFIVE